MSTKSSIKDDHFDGSLSSIQDGRNWRSVIFTPYKMWWKILVVCTILLNIFIALYYLVFTTLHSSLTFTIPFYVCESIYFSDVVLTIMHRFMRSYRRKQLHFPRHALLLTVDIISLFPVYELYYIMEHCSYGDEGAAARDYIKLKVILRLLYAISFYRSIRNHPGVNQIVVVIFGQFYIMLLYILFGSSIWYLVRTDDESIWMNHASHLQINRNGSLDWFLVCFSLIGNAYMHSSAGVVGVKTKWEYFLYTMTMLLGCLMHVMFFFGDLTAQHIQKYQYQLDFSKRLSIIIAMMRDWQTDEGSQKKTVEHYSKYWEMRQGMKDIPLAFWGLPLGMQKEIALDLFWDCFIHTQFFQNCELNFKRSLSVHMYTEFYLPGDYLFCANQQKHKMAYLASGIVQILSQEDQQSPVMSFSSGTLFGEITTMLIVPSLINLRCATYCEIQTLDLRHLCKIMVQYRKASKILHETFNKRITDAKMMQHPLLLKMKDKQQKRTSIRWLKNQWRMIYKHTRKRNADINEIPVTACHMSNYLNMYALSGDVELKERVICLKSTCPYVMEPTSSFRRFVDYIIVLTVVMQCLMVPYDVFFVATMTSADAGLFYMLDLIYIIGLYLELSTAIKTKEILITDPKDIIIFKSKQMSVIIDVLGVFPLEFVGYILGSRSYTCMLLHLNRILKLHKVHRFEKAAERRLLSRAVRLRLFKFSVIFAYCVYFMGCVLYGVACPDKKCRPHGWFSYYINTTRNKDLTDVNTDFMVSISYAVGLLLGLADNTVYTHTLIDIVLGLLVTFIGYCLFSFCFSELAACTVNHLQDDNNFQEFIRVLKVFNTNTDIPAYLKKNMNDITMCEWNYNKRHPITGDDGILSDAPDNLKKTILYQRIVDCLLKVPLFQECDKSILWNLAPFARLNIVPPGTLIGRSDTYQKYLKVILRGYCRAETSIPTDSYRGNYSIYSTGEVFPLMEALLDINTFLKVTSITFTEVACIPFQSIFNQFKNNDPDFYRDLTITMKTFLSDYDTILMRRKGRLPEMVSSRKSYGKGEYFSYDTNEQFDDVEKILVQGIESGKWKFTQRFFLKSSVNTKNVFYIGWECIRCAISLVNIIYTLTVVKYFMAVNLDTYVQLFFLVITFVDCYIRVHCQYYNHKGILVTHPWSTAKHYMTGAFILDFYANFPVTLLNVESMFHGKFRARLPVVLLIATRPFLMYRIYYGLQYIRNQSKEEKAMVIVRIKYILMITVTFLTLSAILEHFTCGYEEHGYLNYTCSPRSWITYSNLRHNVSNWDVVVITNYKVLSLFTTCGLGIFPLRTFWEVCIGNAYIFILFAAKWVLLAKIVSAGIKGDTKLTLYQHDVNIMVKYLQNYLVDETLIKEVVDHYENLFNRYQGYDINQILASFFTVIYADFTYSMYWPVLKTAELFCGSKATDMRYLCSQFKQYIYKKDAQIIRCNDVQEYCYVVYKGKVKISVAGTKLKILSAGGTFGNYQRGKTRQTITATALVHVELLRIESKVLHDISQRFSLVREKLKKAQYLKLEYMNSTGLVDRNKEKIILQECTYGKRWEKFLIDPENKWYAVYNYFLCVHISTITSMLVIVVVARMDIEKSYYLYIVDLIFITKIVVDFHLSYIDHETGILVRNFKSIAKRYATRWKGFWFDLFTCFPFEIICRAITNHKTAYTCCWINRSVRFVHLIFYYNICKNKLTVSKTLKWTYLMYMMVIVIHSMATVWWLVACPNDVCYYVSSISRDHVNYEISRDFAFNFRVTYMYVVSIFSFTGVKNHIPRTIVEVIISIFILIASQMMVYTLTSGFANILRLGKYVLNNYERDMEHINSFMKNANISVPLVNNIRAYLIILWLHYSGVSMPTLIMHAPGYLKQDIMYALYGYHITNHLLFAKTHIDFIRQLLVHMVPIVYLPGQYIIEKGDIDGRMYFVHDGEVKVIDKHGNNEIEQCVLHKGASFGEYQALKNIEHTRSVKTSVMCTIISLKTSDWNYLLDWFPASREILESRLISLSPGRPSIS